MEQDRPVARCVVPRHRVGAVEAALRSLARARGAAGLDPWLHRLWRPLAERDTEPGEAADEAAGEPADGEARWWAARLLAAGLRAGQDPQAHGDLLELMAERLAAAPARCASGTGPVARFGPGFWAELALPAERCWALLRLLVRADGPEQGFLALAAARLTATGVTAFPSLCRWFEDGRALPARPGATVADLAHDLLFAHRALGVDELTEALVDTAHPRADALLTVLAVEEPSALCRAVDRWSHDARPERHVAAAVHALRTAPYATGAGRELLRHTALTLLAREGEPGLHGAALALLVRDPATRARHLTGALAAYAADDPFIGPEVLGPALTTDTGAVLAAFEARLARPGPGAAAVLRVLADAPAGTGGSGAPGSLPDPATRLAGRLLRDRPERAELVAEYLNRRLTLGTAGRGDLTALLGAPPGERAAPVRRAFALVLASPQDDPGPTRALRREFLDRLLATEREPDVLAPPWSGWPTAPPARTRGGPARWCAGSRSPGSGARAGRSAGTRCWCAARAAPPTSRSCSPSGPPMTARPPAGRCWPGCARCWRRAGTRSTRRPRPSARRCGRSPPCCRAQRVFRCPGAERRMARYRGSSSSM